MSPTPLAFGKRGRVLLQNLETVPPVLAVKMIPQSVPGPRGPWASGKGEFVLCHALRETDSKHLWDVFNLTYRQLVPVNLNIRPMHLPSVRRHQSRGKFYYAVWAGYLSSQSVVVRPPPDRAPLFRRLLRHLKP